MLDVYKITSVLEKLPDAALQQYAAMHKQDPYVLSLAVEESNRRKRIRSAPQGQQQPQQPPVNEQAVQAMAPEDTGIAQLPTGDMDFADGGIVAFADGGFSGSIEDLLQREQEEVAAGVRPALSPELQALLAGSVPPAAAPTPPERRPDAGLGALGGAGASTGARTSQSRTSVGPAAPSNPLPDLQRRINEVERGLPTEVPGTPERDAAREASLERQRQLREEFESRLPKGKAFEGLEADLKKEAEGEESKKEKNLKMALINAGLGMMAGTNPNAFVNIGAGAQQGVKTYQEGFKDLEKAAERRRELAIKIEQVRRAEDEGRANQTLVLGQKAAEIEDQWRKAQIDGVMKVYQVNRETAAKMVEMEEVARRDRERLATQEYIAERQESGAWARSAASEKGATTRSNAETLRTLHNSRAARLREIGNEIKALGAFGGQMDPTRIKMLREEQATVTAEMQRLEEKLSELLGIPVTERPQGAGVSTEGWGKPSVVGGR